MTDYRADHYYTYEELTVWLHAQAGAHPDLLRVWSIGQSPEGRELWLAALTDWTTGDAAHRPAYWVDANTHASEVTGSAAALYLIDLVLRERGAWADQLARSALYIVPRVNPDGAEHCLLYGTYVRSAPRVYPDPEPLPGFLEEDLDGDGEVLQLRVIDPDGAWKRSAQDARLLIPRAPWDGPSDGPYYTLYPEGRFSEEAWAQPTRPVGAPAHGLDFNRNYPYQWRAEHEQAGSGDYPLSEPETRAVVDFLRAHRNVFGMMTLHTYSGVLLRPYSDRPDDAMARFDLAVFEALGASAQRHLGYPCVSTFHDFCYDPRALTRGAFDDWAYEHMGVHCYTLELWCPWRAAGLDFTGRLLDFFARRTPEDDLALLRWNDEALDGAGFVPWRAFEHPQLGSVELGGWRWMFTLRNAPPSLLPAECEGTSKLILDLWRAGPQPTLTVSARALGQAHWLVEARCHNGGYLPTYITAHGRDRGITRASRARLTLACGQRLVEGAAQQRLPHLEGRASHTALMPSASAQRGRARDHVAVVRWVVSGDPGEVEISWSGDRIGRHSARVKLP